MARPSIDEIFAEPDEFGLLAVSAAPRRGRHDNDAGAACLREVGAFFERTGRLPDADAVEHDEMRLGTIWAKFAPAPTETMKTADRWGLLDAKEPVKQPSWRDDPTSDDVPASLDDIFGDDELDIAEGATHLRHVTPAAERHTPDHRAEFTPCRDFARFQTFFEDMQAALESGEREAKLVEKGAKFEPLEGDFFIRNGLLAYIAEKSEMSARGGSREHRLRVIFSNGTESDPLMSSFRKSLNDDKTARAVQRTGLGPLDPEWEADKLDLSGTVYVARSLSQDPVIAAESEILHKIGVTSQDVSRRIADARNDPTFLLAPVKIVATYELKNLARSKVENLLHRFFDAARPAELFILDRFGKKTRPREWFYVLPEHVSQAAELIKDGKLHLYRYDVATQKVVKKTQD
jgi:hypothetical protein